MPTILVTGVTGCVGRAVAVAAAARGWTIRGIARSRPVAPLPGVELLTGDVRDETLIAGAVDGCDAVVHGAGWVHRIPCGERDHHELWSSIVDGARVVASACARANARLVALSTVAVLGAPATAYGRAKLAAEDVAASTAPSCVVVRPAVVYGAHDRGNVAALIRAIDRRRFAVVGRGNNRKSVVYAGNLADRLVALATARQVAGPWIAADDPAPTQAELASTIAAALGRRTPPRVPIAPLRVAAAALDGVARLRRDVPPGTWRDRVAKLAAETVFDGTPLDERLGYRPGTSLVEGVRAAVAWYRTTLY